MYDFKQEKHAQIGNAVPPPLARSIGIEIRKSVAKKSERMKKNRPKPIALMPAFKKEELEA
jgi:hypothetical protein